MSDSERLDEAAETLARGVIRLRQRREGRHPPLSGEFGESCLDFSPNRSGHADVQVDGDRR
ncbi:MAG: hypothetical protein HC829_07320 [Bacteroidales bacterium]|nr:hypothetical protein [Bacteroidales bacterium]